MCSSAGSRFLLMKMNDLADAGGPVKPNNCPAPDDYVDPLWYMVRRDAALGNKDAIALLSIVKKPAKEWRLRHGR